MWLEDSSGKSSKWGMQLVDAPLFTLFSFGTIASVVKAKGVAWRSQGSGGSRDGWPPHCGHTGLVRGEGGGVFQAQGCCHQQEGRHSVLAVHLVGEGCQLRDVL